MCKGTRELHLITYYTCCLSVAYMCRGVGYEGGRRGEVGMRGYLPNDYVCMCVDVVLFCQVLFCVHLGPLLCWLREGDGRDGSGGAGSNDGGDCC